MELVTRLRGSIGRRPWHTAVLALALGGFSASTIVTPASAATNHKSKTVVVSTTKNAELGTILVSGRTLYTLTASKTPCAARCRKIWPELMLPKGVKRATAGTGVQTALLGTVKRGGGVLQVTYSGKALYRFSGDKTAGQVHGDVTDTWGTWSVVVMPPPTVSPPSGSNAPATPSTTLTNPSTSPTPTTRPAPATMPTPATAPAPSTGPPPTTPPTSPPPPPTTTPTTSPATTTTAPSTGGVSF